MQSPLVGVLCHDPVQPSAETTHPRLGPNAAHPVRERGDAAEVLDDVLLGDQAHRNGAAYRVGDRRAKQRLGRKAPLGVVPQSAMPEIREDELRL
jgi:hypothetical protein